MHNKNDEHFQHECDIQSIKDDIKPTSFVRSMPLNNRFNEQFLLHTISQNSVMKEILSCIVHRN